jgi:hypothetical protein
MSTHIFVLAFAATFAAVPSARLDHAELLRKMPATLLDKAGGAYPDANGMVGHNREGFKASAFQRGATLKLAIAAARGDERRAEDCWRAVEAVFARQTHEGHFNDPPSSVAFWLCELNRALLVVQQGVLADAFKGRIEALLPKIRLAVDWLAGQRESLFKVDGNTPNRLFFDAEAFAFSGLLLHDEKLVALGKEFLARGMKLYRDEDGVFLELGGGDSSYQAVCLLRLQEIVIHFPDRQVEEAIRKGIQWELGKVEKNGTISSQGNTRVRPGGETFLGHEKQINVGEVLLALLYYHVRTGDREALQTAERVLAHYSQR